MDLKKTPGLIDSYFKQNNGKDLVRHQIDSFNDFMTNKIPDIISQSIHWLCITSFFET